MGWSSKESEGRRGFLSVILYVGVLSCFLLYVALSSASRLNSIRITKSSPSNTERNGFLQMTREAEECCSGINSLELWGPAVKWGTYFRFNSSRECCMACKSMCESGSAHCFCDSWVFCGDIEECGPRIGECWLKKQRDPLSPDVESFGGSVSWTSGLVYRKGEGIIGLKTEFGVLRVQAQLGPPFALIQGTLESVGVAFIAIPREECQPIRRGSVAWIGSGPEFLISLANHLEWKQSYTVFGSVLPEDMKIIEEIARLPTKTNIWSNIPVSVLEKPVNLQLVRIMKASSD